MASRRVPASILECTSPMVSALGMEWPSQRFQNRDAPDISSALRLLSRAQNRIMEALATVAVEMRGSGLRSVMGPISKAERWNTLSEYAIRRRSNSGLPLLQASPFQFGNFLNETLHFLVVRNGLTHSLAPAVAFPGSPQRLDALARARPWGRKSGAACRHDFAPGRRTGATRRWRNGSGSWACRTCWNARRGCREATPGRRPVGQCGNGSCVRQRRVWRG